MLIWPFVAIAQVDEANQNLYEWHDETIGKDHTAVYSGIQYVEQHRMLNDKHKFFDNPNFQLGTVDFENQPFYDLQLKYDVFQDQLLLKHDDRPELPTIVLDKSKVSSFTIGSNLFKRMRFTTKKGKNYHNYVQILLQCENISLFKVNKKELRRRTNEDIRFYEFTPQDHYIILYDGTYYELRETTNLKRLLNDRTLKDILNINASDFEGIEFSEPDDLLIAVLKTICSGTVNTDSRP